MTAQVLDTIRIGGAHHFLAELAPILPPEHAGRIGLEIRHESTANYRGWRAHWDIREGRLYLAELAAFGRLHADEPTKRLEECVDVAEIEAWYRQRESWRMGRWIEFREIFGVEPPIFASWVSCTVAAVCGVDDAQYSREDFGVTGAHTRVIGVENGLVVSDGTLTNSAWNPDRSERRRREAERDRAIKAAKEFGEKRNRRP